MSSSIFMKCPHFDGYRDKYGILQCRHDKNRCPGIACCVECPVLNSISE